MKLNLYFYLIAAAAVSACASAPKKPTPEPGLGTGRFLQIVKLDDEQIMAQFDLTDNTACKQTARDTRYNSAIYYRCSSSTAAVQLPFKAQIRTDVNAAVMNLHARTAALCDRGTSSMLGSSGNNSVTRPCSR